MMTFVADGGVFQASLCSNLLPFRNKGSQEHLQRVYTALAATMLTSAIGAALYFIVPFGVSVFVVICCPSGEPLVQ